MEVIKSGKTLPTVSEHEKTISEFDYSLQGMVMIIRKINFYQLYKTIKYFSFSIHKVTT